MPNSTALWMAVVVLWMMDAAINVSMEPFRAFVGDKLDPSQQTAGFAMQTFFIGCGAVIASLLPTIFDSFGVSATSPIDGAIPDTVRYSFYVGGIVFFLRRAVDRADRRRNCRRPTWQRSAPNAAATGSLGRGARRRSSAASPRCRRPWCSWPPCSSSPGSRCSRCGSTPATPIADNVYGTTDAQSAAFQEAGNWVGIMFAVYSGVSALAAFILPVFARMTSRKMRARDLPDHRRRRAWPASSSSPTKNMLMLPMVGVGIAWASILTDAVRDPGRLAAAPSAWATSWACSTSSS